MQLESYILKPTGKTPFINFDIATGIFEMIGTSIPEDSIEFYAPILDWLDKYIEEPLPKTILKIQLDYFNTSSSKCLFNIILKIDKIAKTEKGLAEIQWVHEDDDESMIDAGESLSATVTIPFKMLPFTDPD